MTSKEFVKEHIPKARAERQVQWRIGGVPYWLIRDWRETMHFATWTSESNAWVNAKKCILEINNK